MTESVFLGTDGGAVVRSTETVATVSRRLGAAGWHVVDLTDVVDELSFHSGIAAALGFPEHYGANLDALWDCLTDLAEPTAVVWNHWPELAVDHPLQWARVLAVLRERATDAPADSPAFAVVLVVDD